MFICLVIITFVGLTTGYQEDVRIGVILREGDGAAEKIIDNVFWRTLSNGPQQIPYISIKEKTPEEDAFYYHRASMLVFKF
ncbi:hypothetical protein TNIN_144561 [Trichonephila inaurata madagascariensis]|uniref:Uncharacterized protein n=1 Tax=Trichonephila inaurata madagascariensis TaxID=2747483 RepID=A0A8X6Y1M8_9ARAC|nr:hypothetical protein TNIN_144561 [Trichonephila inaurata madagascariensis]